MKLAGKTVLLTGATGGLGRAIAAALAERGASLVLSSRKGEELGELARELPGEHRSVVCDLATEGAVHSLLEGAGEVHALVANAGLAGTGSLDSYSEEQLDRVLRVNLEVPLRMTWALLPRMRERGEGHLLYVSSLSGKFASPRTSLYNATKFGLRGFAFAMREELRDSGIGVSVVSPGAVKDAGIFSESGAKLPPGVGPCPPAAVGAAVVRAIERNKIEIPVASPAARMLANVAMVAPELAGRISRRSALKVADSIDRSQLQKR